MNQRDKDYRAAHKVRWGTGWKVVHWNDAYQGWSESHEMDYFAACSAVRAAREEAREKEAMGKPILKAPWPESL